jgi:hypothetical protein
MPGRQKWDPSRKAMIRCVRSTLHGTRGWRVTWLDYEKARWQQSAFFASEGEARALTTKLRRR